MGKEIVLSEVPHLKKVVYGNDFVYGTIDTHGRWVQSTYYIYFGVRGYET